MEGDNSTRLYCTGDVSLEGSRTCSYVYFCWVVLVIFTPKKRNDGKHPDFFFFFFDFWRTQVLFVGPLIPLFWAPGDVFSGFQSQGGSLVCFLNRVMLRFTSGAKPNYHVSTSGSSNPWLCTPAGHTRDFWWLFRVTLVVDWRFLPQNFGQVVGTYKGLLPFCKCTWGGGSICRWWGHLNTKCHNWTFEFFALRGSGEQKTSSNCMGMRPCTLRQLELFRGNAT